MSAAASSARTARFRLGWLGGKAYVLSDPQPSVSQWIDERGKVQDRDSVMTCAIVRRATAEEVRQWQMQG